jgi:phosphoserine phosphatase RsbU/P
MSAVFQALVSGAVEGAGATAGWLLRRDDDVLTVVAAAGEQASALAGMNVPAGSGTAGFVIEAGQPLAIVTRDDDPRFREGVADAIGIHPKSVLCVPCATEMEVVGALELVDKRTGDPFSIDDLELATLLAEIAAAALVELSGADEPPAPELLSGDLKRLAAGDPTRYARVAYLVSDLLRNG